MGSLLLAVIYLIFISLGLPDSLLGSTYNADGFWGSFILRRVCIYGDILHDDYICADKPQNDQKISH